MTAVEVQRKAHARRQKGVHVGTCRETQRSTEAELGRDGWIQNLHMLLNRPQYKSVALGTLMNMGE